MLLRTGVGRRDYYHRQGKCHARGRWEFMAVVEGRIGMVLPSGPDILTRRRLWLSRPEHVHGWTGEKDRMAVISAFQYSFIPEALSRLLPEREAVWNFPLSPEQCRRLKELGHEAQRFWLRPRLGRVLCFEHILTELSLLVVEFLTSGDQLIPRDARFRRMNEAIEWYTTHMAENPPLGKAARAAGVSVAQLRRDFHQWLKASPIEVFTEIRLNHAIDLMGETDLGLELIAEQCGYQSANALSRAFRQKFAQSPRDWWASRIQKGRVGRQGRG